MSHSSIRPLLVLTIFVVAAVPLAAAFYFADRALQTSLDLGFNPSIRQSLQESAENLKALKNLDPARQDRYRLEFQSAERLMRIYSSPQLLKAGLLDSLKIYFGLGLVAAVLLSVLLAALLTRRISGSYDATFAELMRHRDRVRYLEEMASWQELARMLAHEIKNPLTPIEVLVTSLSRAYASKPEPEFRQQLEQTQKMIGEELQHLKNTVSRFSEFAALPPVQLAEEDLPALLTRLTGAIQLAFDAADIEIHAPPKLPARVDGTLLRQVLTNIIRNGLEANPGERVRYTLEVSVRDGPITIAIANDGQPVRAELAARIFDPYVSGKSAKDNMGLGLAIVRKIVIEHGGEITYAERDGHPVFTISLPAVS